MLKTFDVRTGSRTQFVNITAEVRKAVRASGLADGLCVVCVPHTTAGVCVNEAADPDVVSDALGALARLVPEHAGYAHAEGNSDAHIKAILTGSSVQLPVSGGDLVLGTWQGIFFCEYDGPRHRRVAVQTVGAGG